MSVSTPTAFVERLREKRLVDPVHLDALAGLAAGFLDGPALARELVRRGWLTEFQAEALREGRARDLVRGPYRLLGPLGEGAMGQVFQARHAETGAVVALKLLLNKEAFANPRAMARFTREVRAAALLNHPHIVRAVDANLVGDTPYLAMEHVEGTDLARLVKQDGPLPIAHACEYARQAALALQHAHDHGLVHRDVKPHNLMLARTAAGEPPVVKILDFGLARFEWEGNDPGRLTQAGKVLGTVDYMAPEQAADARHVDIRSDIYGLGCTLFFLLTGAPPWPGDDMVEKLSARVLGEPPSARAARSDVPAGLDLVVVKMMAREQAARYQAPAEAALALAPFARIPRAATPVPEALEIHAPSPKPALSATQTGSTESSGPRLPSLPRSSKPDRKRLWLLAGGLAAVLVLAVGGMIASLSWPPASATPTAPPAAKAPPARPPAALRLLPVAGIALERGESKSIDVRCERENCQGPIRVRLFDLPNGVSGDPDSLLLEGDAPGKLTLTAAFGAEEGTRRVRLQAVADDARTESTFQVVVASLPLPEKITNSIRMNLALIPSGQFTMGSPKSEKGRWSDEGPQHDRIILRPFYMGACPVTQDEFARVTGKNPSYFSKNGGGKDLVQGLDTGAFPVEEVSWDDAQAFCEALNKLDARFSTGWSYGLPTEVEWECACRSGTSTAYSFGNDELKLGDYAWYDGNAGGRTHEVGGKKPNAWGLYDMHGDVLQFCTGRLSRYPAKGLIYCPGGDTDAKVRGARGGAWNCSPRNCRAAFRSTLDLNGAGWNIGFRVVLRPGADAP